MTRSNRIKEAEEDLDWAGRFGDEVDLKHATAELEYVKALQPRKSKEGPK
jgi:hypothetical protein